MDRRTLIASGLIASAVISSAEGAPVIFENPAPGFTWQYTQNCISLELGLRLFLDVTQPWNAQALSDATHNNCSYRPSSLCLRWNPTGGPSQPTRMFPDISWGGSPGTGLAFETPYLYQLRVSPSGPELISPPKFFNAGELIGPGANWTPGTNNTSVWIFGNGGYVQTPIVRGCKSWGVRIRIAGQTHYGFVSVVGPSPLNSSVVPWVPVAWGYESEPNTPIAAYMPTCALADLNNDGSVNVEDLATFLGAFGSQTASSYRCDFDGSRNVDTGDLVTFLGAFGCVR